MASIQFTVPRDFDKMSLGQRMQEIVRQLAVHGRETNFRDTLVEAAGELVLMERMTKIRPDWRPKGI